MNELLGSDCPLMLGLWLPAAGEDATWDKAEGALLEVVAPKVGGVEAQQVAA